MTEKEHKKGHGVLVIFILGSWLVAWVLKCVNSIKMQAEDVCTAFPHLLDAYPSSISSVFTLEYYGIVENRELYW